MGVGCAPPNPLRRSGERRTLFGGIRGGSLADNECGSLRNCQQQMKFADFQAQVYSLKFKMK